MTDASRVAVVGSEDGEAWWFLGTLITMKVSGEQTGGRFSIFEALLPKDATPPLHSHPQGETLIVLDGRLKFWVGGVVAQCAPGSIAFAPGHAAHSFLVESGTARVVVLSTPAGIEQMVRAIGDPAPNRRLPDDDAFPPDEKIEAGYAATGVVLHGPSPFRPA